MEEIKQFRDVFNPTMIDAFAERLQGAWTAFDAASFSEHVNPKLAPLSYSERIQLIVDALCVFLPKDYPRALHVLLGAQHPPYDSDVLDGDLGRFIAVPQTYYIAQNGLEHFELSMQALYEMTKRFSSEFGVRAFLIRYPKESLALFEKWTKDPDPHVRRWVSEGSRPYLPWGKKLHFVEEEPALTIAILGELKDDESEYVRRSVANHLNDLAKKHPDLVVETLVGWRKVVSGKNFERLCTHALRTLIKKGHQGALQFKGFRPDVAVDLLDLVCTSSLKMGEKISFSFSIISKSKVSEKLVVDYVVHFKKANGTTAPKVFKLKNMTIAPEGLVPIEKSHAIKPITTRVYYAGTQRLEIQVNGKVLGGVDFELIL